MSAKVLVIDSDHGVVGAFLKSLGRQDFIVTGAFSSDEAWQYLRQQQPQALILDIQVPGPPGVELLREVKALYPALPVIATTAQSNSFTEREARHAGADRYFVKPFDCQALIENLKDLTWPHNGAAAPLLALYKNAAAPRLKLKLWKGGYSMKHNFFLVAAVIATLGTCAVLQAAETDRQRLNLNVWGDGLTAVGGSFNPQSKTSDVVKNGASYGFAWQYFPWRSIGVQAGYEFGGMHFQKPYEPGETQAFVVHQITVAGVYNFANLFGSSARIRPLINAGLGLYPFRINRNGLSGEATQLPNGNNFAKTSFGLNTGAGLEFMATNRVSIVGGAHYQYLFAKDDKKFGADTDFGNQALLSYGLGLQYHFLSSR